MLKIKFLTTTTGGLADHEIPKNCRNVLDRLRANPELHYTNRTGQELVWDIFRALLYTDYHDLQSQVEFWYNNTKVEFDSNMKHKNSNAVPNSLMDAYMCTLLQPLKENCTLKDMGF